MENNIKKRNLWKHLEITEMLSVIKENHVLKLLDSKVKRNKNVFEEVARELKAKGHNKDAVQIRTKFKALKSEYYKVKRNNNTSGAERQTCEYFDLLDEVLSHRPAIATEGEDTSHNNSENGIAESEPPQIQASSSKTFKNPISGKKTSQRVMESFTKDWKQTQDNLIGALKEQNTNYLSTMEKLLEKNRVETAKMLEQDRRETANMFSNMVSMIQPPSLTSMWYPHQIGVPSRSAVLSDSLFSNFLTSQADAPTPECNGIFASTPQSSPAK
ncbi:uncharacterized protein LOC120768749 [Bactrocera tryoni]|uniref:uncharacterized protein LOC120768749 n=1 Tax=Bactrocera tryoni TaxID=59916 RepID=UPI001A95AFB0|nr:uncharacterized protein LOC120768749 [Bactrocera tryoni]